MPTIPQVPPFSDKICYSLNSGAVGDLTAASAVIKYAVDTFHAPRNVDYRVSLQDDFRCLFPQIPEDKMCTFEESVSLEGFAFRRFNMDRAAVQKNVAILTPSRFHLIHYASVGLLARVIKIEDAPYVPLVRVPVDHFEVDFDKAVIFVTTYRDITRHWPAEEINKTAEAVKDMGLLPVFIGKTGAIANWKNNLAKTEWEYPGFGVDLTNKTTLPEMATLMAKSRCVVGMDSGPIHVAMTTDTPVVAGFTNVSPDARIPHRKAPTLPVIANELICRFCQSDWNLDFWNFQKCPRGLEKPECSQMMTAPKFIEAIKKLTGRL